MPSSYRHGSLPSRPHARAAQIVGPAAGIVYHSLLSLSDIFSRRRKDEGEPAEGSADSPVHPTKALPGFLGPLSARSQPLLLDLGPVVGSNVNFFGEELGCKIIVENLYKDVDRHLVEGKLEELPAFLEKRFAQEDSTVDGILCWDIFDYLNRPASQGLARQLIRILRPDGVLFAQFMTTQTQAPGPAPYTKYVVVDRKSLQYRPYGAVRDKQKPLANRDIQRLFEPLRITDQFLLKNNFRELLFRKPAAPDGRGNDPGSAKPEAEPGAGGTAGSGDSSQT